MGIKYNYSYLTTTQVKSGMFILEARDHTSNGFTDVLSVIHDQLFIPSVLSCFR